MESMAEMHLCGVDFDVKTFVVAKFNTISTRFPPVIMHPWDASEYQHNGAHSWARNPPTHFFFDVIKSVSKVYASNDSILVRYASQGASVTAHEKHGVYSTTLHTGQIHGAKLLVTVLGKRRVYLSEI